MLKKDKLTQKIKIKSKIEENGWKIYQLDNSEWWENEVWEMESTWSPLGKRAFVVFENDPMSYDDKILEPWAVTTSPKRLKHRNGESGDFQISLTSNWQKDLPKLIEYLSTLRNK